MHNSPITSNEKIMYDEEVWGKTIDIQNGNGLRDTNTQLMVGDEVVVDGLIEKEWKQGFAARGGKDRIKYILGDLCMYGRLESWVIRAAHSSEDRSNQSGN